MTATREYEPFELLISPLTAAGHPVIVVESPAGDGSALCNLRADDAELRDALHALQSGKVDAAFTRALGEFLYTELFRGDVGDLLQASLAAARRSSRGLRIRLRIEPPELAALPWEYLCAPQDGEHFAVTVETPLVRYVPVRLPARPTAVKPPLRLLVAVAAPQDAPPISVTEELAIIRGALADLIEQGRVSLQVIEHTTLAALSEGLRVLQPHVLQFIGHGAFQRDRACLLLEDEQGRAQAVDESVFQQLFDLSLDTRLAVLNACQSAALSSTQPLVGLAPRLLQRQLAGVVAMQFPITVEAARVFTREFYRSLAAGFPIDAAVSAGRKGIFTHFQAARPEWGTPVLFLRAKDGKLFDVEQVEIPAIQIPPPPAPRAVPATAGFIGRRRELDEHLRRLEAGNLTVISGMAGVGKSSLAAALAQAAAEPDQVYWYTFTQQTAIRTMLHDLAGFLAWHRRPEVWNLLEGARLSGGRLPEIEVVVSYLLQSLRGGRFLLCFDDFHHVDEDADLNQFLDRVRGELATGRFQVIVTARRMPAFADRAEFQILTGLSAEDAQQIVWSRGVTLTHEHMQQLYAITQGNAEFLTLAIDALQQGAAPDRLLANLAASDNIESYLLAQVDETLTGQERKVLGAIAVFLGHQVGRAEIEAVVNSGNLFRPLLRLAERHLVLVQQAGEERLYRLHDILRAYFYQELGSERRRLHLRAGAHFRDQRGDPLFAAIHFQRGGDTTEAARLAAGSVWEILNRGQARGLHDLLAGFHEDGFDLLAWARICLARGQTCAFLADAACARAAYNEALAQLELVTPAEGAELAAAACRGLGELLELEQPQAALDWLQRGLDAVQTGPPAARAAVLAKIGGIYMQTGAYPQATAALLASLADFANPLDPMRTVAMMNLGSVLYYQGNLAGARRHVQGAILISRKLHHTYQVANLLNIESLIEYDAGNYRRSIALSQESLALAEALGSEQIKASALVNLAETHLQLGDAGGAAPCITTCLALAETNQWHQLRVYALIHQARLHGLQGDYAAAAAILQAAEALAQQIELSGALTYCFWTRADLERRQGRYDQALAAVDAAIALAVELGEAAEEGRSRRLRGQILQALGRAAEAGEEYTRALDLLGDRNPFEQAQTKLDYSTTLAATGADEVAAQLRSEATHMLAQLQPVNALAEQ